MVKVNLTTIQIRKETRKKLEMKKAHPRESYDAVLQRMFETESISIPSMAEMFKIGDSMKQSRRYSTQEVVELTHRLRNKR